MAGPAPLASCGSGEADVGCAGRLRLLQRPNQLVAATFDGAKPFDIGASRLGKLQADGIVAQRFNTQAGPILFATAQQSVLAVAQAHAANGLA